MEAWKAMVGNSLERILTHRAYQRRRMQKGLVLVKHSSRTTPILKKEHVHPETTRSRVVDTRKGGLMLLRDLNSIPDVELSGLTSQRVHPSMAGEGQ